MKILLNIAIGIVLIWLAAWATEEPPAQWILAYVAILAIGVVVGIWFLLYYDYVADKKYQRMLEKYNLVEFDKQINHEQTIQNTSEERHDSHYSRSHPRRAR